MLHEPLRGPGVTVDDVRASTEAVTVALEIVDSRIADWKLTLPDTVADNASSGAVVLGEWVPYSADIDLAARRWMSFGEYLFLKFFGTPTASTSMVSGSGPMKMIPAAAQARASSGFSESRP